MILKFNMAHPKDFERSDYCNSIKTVKNVLLQNLVEKLNNIVSAEDLSSAEEKEVWRGSESPEGTDIWFLSA